MSRFKTAVVILVSIAVLYFAQDVFIPLVLAAVLAMLLSGPVQRLERWRIPRTVAVTSCVVVAAGLIVGIGWLVAAQIVSLADNLPTYKGEIRYKLAQVRGSAGTAEKFNKLQQFKKDIINEGAPHAATQPTTVPATQPAGVSWPRVAGAIEAATNLTVQSSTAQPATRPAAPPNGTEESPLYVFAMQPPQNAMSAATKYLGLTLGPLGTAGIVLVFVFFILLEREDLRDRLIRLVSNGKLTITTTAVDDGITRVLKFMRAQAIVNGTYGLAVAAGLCVISLTLDDRHEVFPSFMIWGLLAAVLRFVPYIGPWIAAAFPIVVSLAAFHGFAVPLAVISMFVVIELLSNNIMEPMLYGASTGLSTMAVLVSAVFWTWLWGPIGLVLSTPLTVCMMVVGRYVPSLRFLEVLLGDRPAMTPNERVYQRLLAGDEDEALDVAQEHLKENNLATTYDDVLLPALYMCEQDDAQGLLRGDLGETVRAGMRRIIDTLAQDAAKPVNGTAAKSPTPSPATPRKPCPRIIVLPARDEGDDLAGIMIANVLRQSGCEPMTLSSDSLASEMVESVTQFNPHVVCISAMPPAAVSHVRYLLRRLNNRLAGQRLNLALWNAKTDLPTLRRQLDIPEAALSTTVAETVAAIARLTEAVPFETTTAEPAIV